MVLILRVADCAFGWSSGSHDCFSSSSSFIFEEPWREIKVLKGSSSRGGGKVLQQHNIWKTINELWLPVVLLMGFTSPLFPLPNMVDICINW